MIVRNNNNLDCAEIFYINDNNWNVKKEHILDNINDYKLEIFNLYKKEIIGMPGYGYNDKVEYHLINAYSIESVNKKIEVYENIIELLKQQIEKNN